MPNAMYEGWSNRQTWGVNLWLSNEEPLYRHTQRLVAAHPDNNALAAAIEEFVEEMTPDLGASLFSDLQTWALAEVDWFEIAKAWREDS